MPQVHCFCLTLCTKHLAPLKKWKCLLFSLYKMKKFPCHNKMTVVTIFFKCKACEKGKKAYVLIIPFQQISSMQFSNASRKTTAKSSEPFASRRPTTKALNKNLLNILFFSDLSTVSPLHCNYPCSKSAVPTWHLLEAAGKFWHVEASLEQGNLFPCFG